MPGLMKTLLEEGPNNLAPCGKQVVDSLQTTAASVHLACDPTEARSSSTSFNTSAAAAAQTPPGAAASTSNGAITETGTILSAAPAQQMPTPQRAPQDEAPHAQAGPSMRAGNGSPAAIFAPLDADPVPRGMEAATKHLEQIDKEVAHLTAKVEDLIAAILSARDSQERADLKKEIWQQLNDRLQGFPAERRLYAPLPGPGTVEPGAVEPAQALKPQIDSLGAAVSCLRGLGFGQPVERRSEKDREEVFILNRDDVAKKVLGLVRQTISAAGAVDRKRGQLLTLETGSGVGKTYAAKKIDVLLERAARAAATGQPAVKSLQELLAAFDEERVAVLNFDFNGGGDFISKEDAMPSCKPSVALGIRLAARGLFGVSTKTLRKKLLRLPEGVESLFTVTDVWPLVCQRLRMAHGLAADPSADARPLILIVTFDEFQLLTRDMQKDFGYTESAARSFCKDFQRELAYLVLTEGGDTSPAAKHGVYLVPMLLGTCLSALEDYEVTLLTWDRGYLQPLSFEDSRLLFETQIASIDGLFLRLADKPHILATLELAGGIPALIVEAAQTLATDEEVHPYAQDTMLDDNPTDRQMCCFTTLWLQKWMARLRRRYRMEVILERICGGDLQHLPQVARRLLLLMLTGTPIREGQRLCEASGATLGDALVSGAFYVRAEGTRLVVSMPAILLMLLKQTEGALEACTAGECSAINHLTPEGPLLHRETCGTVSEALLQALSVLGAACRLDLGISVDVCGMKMAGDTAPRFYGTAAITQCWDSSPFGPVRIDKLLDLKAGILLSKRPQKQNDEEQWLAATPVEDKTWALFLS